MEEAEAAARLGAEAIEVLAGGLQEREGPHEIGRDEGRRAVDRAVDVGLGREVEQGRGFVDAQHLVHGGPIGDVGLDELEERAPAHVLEAQEVAGVGELVHDHDADAPSDGEAHEVAADGARPAGDDPGLAQT